MGAFQPARGLSNCTKERDGVGPSRRETAFHLTLLVLLPVLVFANSLQGEYHLDDVYRVEQNQELERVFPVTRHFTDPGTSATLPHLEQYRPMLPLSLSINLAVSRALSISPRLGYHLGNLAIHIVTVLLLYVLFRELLVHWSIRIGPRKLGSRVALAAAAMFGVHPVAGVPVNYICGRDLGLMLMFLAASLLTYVRWRRLGGGIWRWPVMVLLFAASMLSKTNAVAAPLLFLLFEYTVGGAPPRGLKPLMRAAPFILCAAGFFAFTRFALGFSDLSQLQVQRQSVFEYPLTQASLHLFYYLRNAIWPFEMHALPEIVPAVMSDPDVWAGVAVIAGSAALAWLLRRRAPLVTFSIGAYWMMFVPTSSVLPLRSLATDYRQVPSLAFLCLGVALAAWYGLRGRGRVIAAAIAIAWFGATAAWNNQHWRTEESLWAQSIRHGGQATAHMNYGVAVRDNSPDLAETHFRRAIEMVPDHVYAHINLGLLQIHRGRTDGLELVEFAAEVRPDWALTHHWLSVAYELCDRLDDAAASSWRAHELEEDQPMYTAQAGKSMYAAARRAQLKGCVSDSLPHLRRLHALVPSYRDSLFLEGYALQVSGRVDEAMARYQNYLVDLPDDPKSHFNLAWAHHQNGNDADAVSHLRRALHGDPDFEPAARLLEELCGGG